jgi:hypothetical protein
MSDLKLVKILNFYLINLGNTVCLKKKPHHFSSSISHQWKKIFAPNFHYFVGNLVGNEMACSNLPGKIPLKLETKSSRNGAFFNQNISLSIGWKLRFFAFS